MSECEFGLLFARVLEEAAINAEVRLKRPVSRDFEIEQHGATSHSGAALLTPDESLMTLYLGPDSFYRIIDVGVIAVRASKTTVFVCVSGHQPSSFEHTWNQPPGNGPFKQIIFDQISTAGGRNDQ
jgi:hypothetical protein